MFLRRGGITENSSRTKHKICLHGFFFFLVFAFLFCLSWLFEWVPLCTPIQNSIKMNNSKKTSLGLEDARAQWLWKIRTVKWPPLLPRTSTSPRVPEFREFQVEPGRANTSPILVKIGNSIPNPTHLPLHQLLDIKKKNAASSTWKRVDGGTEAYAC